MNPFPNYHRLNLSSTICIVAISAILAGCSFKMPWMVKTEVPCSLDSNMTDLEVLQHVNQKVRQIFAWQSNDIKIRTHGPGSVPIQLSANIAVEAPRRFRLVAKSILGYEADLGSNNERFWFWMKRSEPKFVYTVRHDQIDAIESRMPIPMRPDWLMQALGVIPIDENNVSFLQSQPEEQLTILSIAEILPSGQNVTRVIKIDRCHGNIFSHELYNQNNEIIARAELSDYRVDATTLINMPHRLALSWPKSGYGMTLTIGNIEVNPPQIPNSLWTIPHHDKVLDLASHFERMSRGQNVIPVSSQSQTERSLWQNSNSLKRQPAVRSNQPAPFPTQLDSAKRPRPVFSDDSKPSWKQ